MSEHPAWDAYITHVRDLYEIANRPSMRSVATEARVSHTTVHDAISGNRIVGWSALERIIRALDGKPAEIHALWRAAYDERRPPAPLPTAPLAPGERPPRAVDREILAKLEELQAMLKELTSEKT